VEELLVEVLATPAMWKSEDEPVSYNRWTKVFIPTLIPPEPILCIMNQTEVSHTFSDHFSNVAARYADFRPHYPADLFDYLATLVPQDSTVWDCACGNGQATSDLAGRFFKVFATDASREQIASAKPHPNVEYRVALAEQSGLPAGSVQLLTVAQALHWFDLTRFYSEARRVLCPGGVIAAWAYGINQVEGEAANQIVQDFYSNVVGPYWPPERKLVEDGYRGISFPFEEITPPAFRMQAHWNLEQLLGYFSTWSATNRFIKSIGQNPLPPLAAALEKVWTDSASLKTVTWPLTLRVGHL
jgi:SAM-dependent methyltransferase